MISAYVQEVGRSGRDNLPAVATLFYNNSDLGGNVEGMTDTIWQYCRITTCRREFFCQALGSALQKEDRPRLHDCCDNCSSLCHCDTCLCTSMDSMAVDTSTPPGEQSVEDEIQTFLEEYIHHQTIAMPIVGLDSALAHSIAQDYKDYSDFRNVLEAYAYLPSFVARNISLIIQQFID